MIDLLKVDYRLTLLPPSGSKIDITNLFQSAVHEEMEGEMAARLTVNLKNIKREDGWIHQHVFLDKRLVLEATDGSGWEEIFRGSIKRWKTVADDHTVDITAYDPLYATMRSKEHYYFPNGMTGASSIKQIAGEQGISVGRIDGPTVSLGRKMYNSYIGDAIAKRLEESVEKGSGGYIARSTKGKLEVVKEGTNSLVYELTDLTVESSSDERSIEDLVTRVKLYGNVPVKKPKAKPKPKPKPDDKDKPKATVALITPAATPAKTNTEINKDKRPAVSVTVNGKTEFGVIQEILYKSNFDSNAAATEAANAILKEKGKPKIIRPLIHPDVPWIRKGDKVAVASGTIGGAVVNGAQGTTICIVESISRDLSTRKMTLKLKGV